MGGVRRRDSRGGRGGRQGWKEGEGWEPWDERWEGGAQRVGGEKVGLGGRKGSSGGRAWREGMVGRDVCMIAAFSKVHSPLLPSRTHSPPSTHTPVTHTYIPSPLSTEALSTNSEVGVSQEGRGMSNEEGIGGDPADQPSNVDVPSAMKLIHHKGARGVSSKAKSVPKDAYFAFLLLRHLRIRDMRSKVGGANAVMM